MSNSRNKINHNNPKVKSKQMIKHGWGDDEKIVVDHKKWIVLNGNQQKEQRIKG